MEAIGRRIIEQLVLQHARGCPSPYSSDFGRIACELGIPDCLGPSGEIVHAALKSLWNTVKRWLAEDANEKCLLLIDNNDGKFIISAGVWREH
jgi:hypothetical protein